MITSCYECGKEVSDKAVACPHCGAPVLDSTPKILCINFDGKWAAMDAKVNIWVNNQYVGDFSFINGFCINVPFEGNCVSIECKVGPRKFNFNPVIPNQYNDNKYCFNLLYSRFTGGFGYALTDSSKRIIDIQHLNLVMGIIVFLFPVIGLIYGFTNFKTKPALSKITFITSGFGFGIGLFILFLFSFQYYPDISILLNFIIALLGGGLVGTIFILKYIISDFLDLFLILT